MRRMMLVAGAVALVLVAAACGDDSDSSSATTAGAAATTAAAPASTAAAAATTEAAPEPEATEVDLTLADFSYAGAAESVPAGLVTISAKNTSTAEEHQATIVRLNDGVTMDQALSTFAQNEVEGFKLITVHGGPNGIGPGGSQATTQQLEPGNYFFACFIPSPSDGIPHAAKGMLQPFTVTEATGEAAATPATDGQIITDDFKYTVPPSFNGKGTFEVFNAAQQAHEMTLYKVAEGKTLADVQAFFTSTEPPAGPPPISSAGGSAAASPGTSIVVPLDLDAGNYVMVCFVPDKDSGQPHIALGMIQSFTVS